MSLTPAPAVGVGIDIGSSGSPGAMVGVIGQTLGSSMLTTHRVVEQRQQERGRKEAPDLIQRYLLEEWKECRSPYTIVEKDRIPEGYLGEANRYILAVASDGKLHWNKHFRIDSNVGSKQKTDTGGDNVASSKEPTIHAGWIVALYLPTTRDKTSTHSGIHSGSLTIARLRALGTLFRAWHVSRAVLITDLEVKSTTRSTVELAASKACLHDPDDVMAADAVQSNNRSLCGYEIEFRRSEDFVFKYRSNDLVPAYRGLKLSEILREFCRDETVPHGWAKRQHHRPVLRSYGLRPGACCEIVPKNDTAPHVAFVYPMRAADIPPYTVITDAIAKPIAGVMSRSKPVLGLEFLDGFLDPALLA